MNRILNLICFVFLSLLCGCGYTTSSLGGIDRSIYVETFTNNVDFTTESRRNIYLPLLEVEVRKAIIDRYLFDGNLDITNTDTADWTLKGSLNSFERTGLRFTDGDDVQEYRIYIVVSLQLVDNRTKEVIWQEPNFVGEATYFVTGPQATSEESAVDEAVLDLARRIVERTVEDW